MARKTKIFQVEKSVFNLNLGAYDDKVVADTNGYYEPQMVPVLYNCCREGDIVVDVGANTGLHAIPLARKF